MREFESANTDAALPMIQKTMCGSRNATSKVIVSEVRLPPCDPRVSSENTLHCLMQLLNSRSRQNK